MFTPSPGCRRGLHCIIPLMETCFVLYNKESDHWTSSINWTKSKLTHLISAASPSHSIQRTPRRRPLNHGSQCHPSAASLAPLVIAAGRIVWAAEAWARVEGWLGIPRDADFQTGKHYPQDFLSFSLILIWGARPHWMSTQELGMSDVEMPYIQMFVVWEDRISVVDI